jgi:negative regulator of sigma E activity
VVDKFAVLLFLEPIRCRKCLYRFFRFSNPVARVLVPLGVATVLTLVVFVGLQAVNRGTFRRPVEVPTVPVKTKLVDVQDMGVPASIPPAPVPEVPAP